MRDLRDALRALPKPELRAALSKLDDKACAALMYDWDVVWARASQVEPGGDWNTWLILAGRGFGKTRTGAEWVRSNVQTRRARRIALVGRTAADVRDTMVEGESGILATSPPHMRPNYEPSKRRLTWPNGAIATCFSADEPDLLRGPQHDLAWADELAAWRYADAWDQLRFGLRLGKKPRVVVTTTPRPTKLIRELMTDPTTHVTTGNTYENRDNLADVFVQKIVKKYEGTRLGRQELYAEILDDTPGALWNRKMIEDLRKQAPPKLTRIVVAIDPSVTAKEGSNEAGIVVAGIGVDKHAYVLEDLSDVLSPDAWARRAVEAFKAQQADRIVAEVNNGGDLVETTIRTVDRNVPYLAVRASRGKVTRAEPIAALYEQGRVHHIGMHPKLEDQMCTWVPGEIEGSPDRVDALVWALTALMLGPGAFRTDFEIAENAEDEEAAYLAEQRNPPGYD